MTSWPVQWRRIMAMTKKELITFASYRISMVMRMLEIWYFAISFYFIDRFVGDVALLEDLDGGYFEYVLIGSIVSSFSRVGIDSFSALVSEEQDDGTLEIVLATPTPTFTLLAGSFVVPVVFLAVETTVLVGVGLGVFGSGIPALGLLKSVPLLLLTTLSFIPVGVLGAAFIVLAKQGDPFSAVTNRVAILLSGALYPLSVLPDWMRFASRFVPSSYAVEGVRHLTQDVESPHGVLDETIILTVFVVVALPLSLAVFRWAVNTARRAGTLGTY